MLACLIINHYIITAVLTKVVQQKCNLSVRDRMPIGIMGSQEFGAA